MVFGFVKQIASCSKVDALQILCVTQNREASPAQSQSDSHYLPAEIHGRGPIIASLLRFLRNDKLRLLVLAPVQSRSEANGRKLMIYIKATRREPPNPWQAIKTISMRTFLSAFKLRPSLLIRSAAL